jgi:hypothetical protein
MKVYVKKDKGLKLLGEGKVYSKKELMLKEFKAGGNNVVATVPGATNVRQFVNQGAKTYNQNGNVGLIQGEMGQFDNQNDSNTGEGIGVDLPVNATGQQIAKVQNMANQPSNDDMKINLTPPTTETDQTDSLGENKIIKMRENSVPFTKSELTEFLKSL